MFQVKRSDTLIRTIEATYGINLNTRGDTKLGNLLYDRGFESLSQLLKAYRGQLDFHPIKRRIFLSFHYEDRAQVQGFRLMSMNKNIDLEFFETSLRAPVNSENSSYVRSVIRAKIARSSILVCLVGNGTAWREWVDWEICTAQMMHRGICGVRLKGARSRNPPGLYGHPIASWDTGEIVAAIECAAAVRS